jgi:hypothetical protein
MLNPLGAVVLADGECPRTFTGRARETVSGGQFVVVSGTANPVSSGADSFATSDLVVALIGNTTACNGIALNNAGSNQLVTVATRGTYIVRAADAVSGGHLVYPVNGTVQGVATVPINISYSGTTIGRSLTDAASGTNLFTVISLCA